MRWEWEGGAPAAEASVLREPETRIEKREEAAAPDDPDATAPATVVS
jgi:hypothetical protein